jgi:hypothetical protein
MNKMKKVFIFRLNKLGAGLGNVGKGGLKFSTPNAT